MYDNLESLKNKNSSKTYDNSTDSLEALRDKLDTIDTNVTIIGTTETLIEKSLVCGNDIAAGAFCDISGGLAYGEGYFGTVSVGSPNTAISTLFSASLDAHDIDYMGDGKYVRALYHSSTGYLAAQILDTVGNSVTAIGSITIAVSATPSQVKVVALSTSKIVIIFRRDSVSGQAGYIVGDVAGSTITFGSVASFDTEICTVLDACKVDSTHIAIVYYGASTNQTSVVYGTISGTTMTIGAKAKLTTANLTTNQASIKAIDASTIFIGYRNADDSNNGYGRVGTISGTTITLGTAVKFNTGTVYEPTVAILDSTHTVISFRRYSSGYKLSSVAASISGTTITFGSVADTSIANTEYQECIKGSGSAFIIVFKNTENNYIYYVTATISAGTITYGTPTSFYTTNISYGKASGYDGIVLYVAETGSSTVLLPVAAHYFLTDYYALAETAGVAGETKNIFNIWNKRISCEYKWNLHRKNVC